jgi:hypothetical protein
VSMLDLQAIVSEHYAALYRFGLALTKNQSEAAGDSNIPSEPYSENGWNLMFQKKDGCS